MARPRSLKSLVAFNAGEMTPVMGARADTEKYQNGCRIQRNGFPLVQGGYTRRRGLQYIATTKVSTAGAPVRLIRFKFSATDQLMIEMGSGYLRFYTKARASIAASSTVTAWVTATPYVVNNFVTNAATKYRCLVAHTSGVFATDLAAGKWVAQTAYEIASPYLLTDVMDVRFAQFEDVMIMTHPSYAPQKLTRLASDSWTMAALDLTTAGYPPLLDEGYGVVAVSPGDGSTLEASATAVGTGVTLAAKTAGGASITDFFMSPMVGSYFRINHRVAAQNEELRLNATAASTAIQVPDQGSFDFNTGTGTTWLGTLEVQSSPDNSTWTTIHKLVRDGTADSNFTGSVTNESGGILYYRLNYTSTSGDSFAHILTPDQIIGGLVVVTAVTAGGASATVTILKRLYATTATTRWSMGAFGVAKPDSSFIGYAPNYPTACTFFQQRLWFGGTLLEPQKFWGSRIAGFFDFTSGTLADDAVAFNISSSERNKILWMTGQQKLVIGTTGGVVAAYGDELEAVITATKPPLILKQNDISCENERALLVANAIIFLQLSGRAMREMVFDGSQGVFTADNLNILANHITAGGLGSLAFQTDRDTIVWSVTGNGKLVGMTYDKTQNVIAWHRHDTGATGMDTIESVETIYNGGDDADVWITVMRNINGTPTRMIEAMSGYYLPSVDDPALTAPEYADEIFLDSYVYQTQASSTTVTGLAHLNGMTVQALANGVWRTGLAVSGGSLTLPVAATKVAVGIPYDSHLQPMRIDTDPAVGNGQGCIKRIHHLVLRLLDSGGCYVAETPSAAGVLLRLPIAQEAAVVAGTALFSGDADHPYEANYDMDATFVLKNRGPYPLTVLGVFVKYTVTENP